jgi:nucleotide-binding universal stress UspA family protein
MAGDGNALRNVVVATDFSPGAAAALGRAAWLPMKPRATLSIVHVVPETVPSHLRAAVAKQAKGRLRGAAAQVARIAEDRGMEVQIASAILFGSPYVEIVRHARSTGADLVVVGRHGARGVRNAFIGSTAERVVRKGDVPVLVVHEKATGQYRRALAAIDLSDTSRRIVDLALALLPKKADPLRIVHAFHVAFEGWLVGGAHEEYRREYQAVATAALKKLAATYAAKGIACRFTVREGDPRIEVLREAVRGRCDLIVAGTHARSGLAHALLGSVAEWLVRAVPCDVAVTRPARFTFELP